MYQQWENYLTVPDPLTPKVCTSENSHSVNGAIHKCILPMSLFPLPLSLSLRYHHPRRRSTWISHRRFRPGFPFPALLSRRVFFFSERNLRQITLPVPMFSMG